jgi:two-component system, NarL family, sensor histidine kinase UhpB
MTISAHEQRRAAGQFSEGRPEDGQREDAMVSNVNLAPLERERERPRRRVLDDRLASVPQHHGEIRQEERHRIARDIHDHLGQQMTALRLHLETLYIECQAYPALLVQIAKGQALTEALDRGFDDVVLRGRSAPPAQDDLVVALSTIVNEWSLQFGIPAECAVSSEAAARLSTCAAANLCAITEEALHNVVKHARATSVIVSLSRRGDGAVLVIEDNGRGFIPACSSADKNGFGLLTMRERAQLVGGEIEIESSSGCGTTIYIRIPATR